MPSAKQPDGKALFGRRLGAARKQLGWSQEKLSLESGVARSYLGGVERGQRNIARVNIARLAETAGEQPVPVIPEGKYLRTVFVDNPDGIEGWPQDYPRELDTWISSDGTKTIYETMGVQQNRASWRVLPWEQLAGVREVEQMPTDPNALFRVVLPDGVDESDPFAEEYAFDHFLDIVRYGYAPPGVNQAAITAMGLLSSVHVEPSVSYLGEPCLRVTRTEVNRDSEESYGCFQESTGHLLEWGSDYPGSAPFISVLMSRELLDEGPTEPVDPPRLNN